MSKLPKIFGRKDDDDADEQPGAQPDDVTESAAEPQGDESHPPAAMPVEPSAAPAPAVDAPSTYASIEEYEETLPKPDALS